MICDEAERSIHDALCVLRCLVKNKGIIGGGGAVEIELCRQLEEYSQSLVKGALSQVVQAYSEALEIIPLTLAENCGILFGNASPSIS